MSPFVTIFGAACDALAGYSGEAVTYLAPGSAPIVVAGTIVGNERVSERPGRQGLTKVRTRQFSLRRTIVDQPLLNASVSYAGEKWPITAVVSQDLTLTRVECELELLRDSSKGGHRPRI